MKFLKVLLISVTLISCQKKEIKNLKDIQWIKKNPPETQAKPYQMNSKPVLIQGARIITANGIIHERGNLLMANGLIQEVGTKEIKPKTDTVVIDGTGLTVTPGLIDVHSHMGVYPAPNLDAHEDGNEMTRSVTPDVWAEHAFWPQDPDLWRALEGGITTIQVLPGSGNLFGGRSLTVKLIPELSAREMRFSGAPQGLKMACGENPKRVYREKDVMTRMGNMIGYRKAFQTALEYARDLKEGEKNGKPLKRDFVSETLVKVLEGEILVQFHCYRADDISAILDLAKEYGFSIRAIHHGLEAYKLAPRLAKENVAVATWADWWGFKAEAYDGIPQNVALLENAGGRPVIHSDSPVDIRFLNVETGKAWSAAKTLGLDFSEDTAFSWITANPAWVIGLDDKIGTLEKGKMADVVLWDGHPFSVYSKTKMVFINGKPVFDRDKKQRPRSDFEIGYNDMAFYDGRDFTKPTPPALLQPPELPKEAVPTTENDFDVTNVKAFVDGKWVEDATVSVRAGKIMGINAKATPATTVINGKGKFLTPGLIESNSYLGVYEISLDSLSQDLRTDRSKPHPDFQTEDALNPRTIRIPLKRNGGVTTSLVRIDGGIAAGMGAAFDMIEGGDIQSHIALYGSVDKYRDKNHTVNRAEIWSQLRTLISDTILYMKNKNAYFAGNTPHLSVHYRHLEAMIPVLKGETPWVLQADRADDIEKIIRLKEANHAKGLPIRFVIFGGAEAWMVADKLAQHKIPVILTPTDQTPQSFNKATARLDLAAYLNNKGVTILINDNNDYSTARLRQEAGMAVKYGLSTEAAMAAITETPAEVFRLNKGKIATNMAANLVLWNADPLEPMSTPEKVWINGKDQSLSNRQQELAEKYFKMQQ